MPTCELVPDESGVTVAPVREDCELAPTNSPPAVAPVAWGTIVPSGVAERGWLSAAINCASTSPGSPTAGAVTGGVEGRSLRAVGSPGVPTPDPAPGVVALVDAAPL